MSPKRRRDVRMRSVYLIIDSVTITDENTIDTIDMSLISMLSEGPEVSLNGSPTVSPTTPAL